MHFDFCFTLCFTGNLPFKPWIVMVVFFPYFLMTVWILSGSRSSTDYTSIEWPMCSWVTDVQRVKDANSTRSLTCMRRKTASLGHDLSILTVCGFFSHFLLFNTILKSNVIHSIIYIKITAIYFYFFKLLPYM